MKECLEWINHLMARNTVSVPSITGLLMKEVDEIKAPRALSDLFQSPL